MSIDYNRQFKEALSALKAKERLLLHTCCAVCAGGVLAREFDVPANRGGRGSLHPGKKRLADFFDITLYFYNPNIDTQEEYLKRAGELEKLKTAFAIQEIIIADYNPGEFSAQTKDTEKESERGRRCNACIELRLNRTAEYAAQNRYGRFTSTLSVSPHKDAETINDIGFAERSSRPEQGGTERGGAARRFALFLSADFKKENGFLTATQTADELGIYRQNYCGCFYSKK